MPTQSDAGTLMGELLRRFWLPVLSDELPERDGPPKKIVVMGNRDTRGRVGIIDQHCPHRSQPLARAQRRVWNPLRLSGLEV